LSSFSANDSITGAVAAASVSAVLALRVVRMVLEVTARKQSSERLAELIRSAERHAERLAQLAEEDGAAYAAYVEARRKRSPEIQATLRRAIETPLEAARAAAEGIELCVEVATFTRGAITADVKGAAALLAGAVRAILCTIDVNVSAVEDPAFAHTVREERRKLEERAAGGAGAFACQS
jgi:formiminotetrahydrofolate cyclodeaminase